MVNFKSLVATFGVSVIKCGNWGSSKNLLKHKTKL